MIHRRQLLSAIAVGVGLGPLLLWRERNSAEPARAAGAQFPFKRTEDEWRRILPPERYRILRQHATERAFSSPLDHERRPGAYVCAGCRHPLFASASKFDSGTGWPSFWAPLHSAVGTRVDRSLFMVRTEVHCANCGGHLGHVFHDGPPPTGLRYCMNGLSLIFVPSSQGGSTAREAVRACHRDRLGLGWAWLRGGSGVGQSLATANTAAAMAAGSQAAFFASR